MPVVLFAVACCVGVTLVAVAMIDAVIVVVVAATIVTAVVIAGDANQCNAFQFHTPKCLKSYWWKNVLDEHVDVNFTMGSFIMCPSLGTARQEISLSIIVSWLQGSQHSNCMNADVDEALIRRRHAHLNQTADLPS